jgi:hypothetical protein
MKKMLFIAIALLSFESLGSSFTSSSNETYMMVPAKPAASSTVSINEITNTDYFSKPVRILNYPNLYGAAEAAESIILRANNFSFTSSIEVVGKSAQVIIVGSNATQSTISCKNCRFIGMEKLIFAGEVKLEGGKPTEVLSAKRILIDNFQSPGVPITSFAARDISLSGLVNNHSRAQQLANGDYDFSESGGLITGGGSFSFFDGDFSISLTDLEPKQLTTGKGNLTLATNLSINSTSIKMVSDKSTQIFINGVLNTKSDITKATSVDEKFYAAEEGVFITSLNDALVTVTGSLVSDNEVYISSNNSLKLKSQSSLVSTSISVFTKNSFLNDGAIYADLLKVSSKNITNHSFINVDSAEFLASSIIENSHGGAIIGHDLSFISDKFFLNGSRTTSAICYKNVPSSGWFTYPPASEPCPNGGVEMPITENIKPLTLAVQKESVFGTYVRSKKTDTDAESQYPMKGSSALIYGSNVYVKSKYFENINPYSEYSDTVNGWVNGIPLNVNAANQVKLFAESNLQVVADEYILNSSAIISLNDKVANGGLLLKSKKIYNERYRMSALFDVEESLVNSTLVKQLKPYYYIYSSPGQIKSVGDLKVESEVEFLNLNSFVESYSSIYVDSPIFSSYGINITDTLLSSETVKSMRNATLDCEFISDKQFEQCRTQQVIEEVIVIADPFAIDTLIYAGEGIKTNSDFIMDNNNLIDMFNELVGLKRYEQTQICVDFVFLWSTIICDAYHSVKVDLAKDEIVVNYYDKTSDPYNFAGRYGMLTTEIYPGKYSEYAAKVRASLIADAQKVLSQQN